ncbi:DUF4398 domain-containing protein [Bradymonas sediminis]|uniref:Uncharacterized protein n=1 Tax=Bradymonas sediminis TaxID=1548548 RepID=A0A2Z4FQA3_9DELT|nr:DUF4398 domain-containing protein [Bradymonas sediminis]AWV91207.1 hypothetical protein DN745_18495 [Bradymonas sediminis]TDP73772.1 uncharacterized protein DUF4398 [Bradymonas sediminis]
MFISRNSSPASNASRRLVGAGVLAILLLGMVGCGPVQSTSRISDAKVAFERARVAEAHNKAPFEYYSAQYYLHKANEEWGYSDFEAAYDYATRAEEDAREATIKAKEDPWPGSPVDEARQREALEKADMKAGPGPTGF